MKRWMAVAGVMAVAGTTLAVRAGEGPKPGQTPYARWRYGPPADPGYFPIAVWLQGPQNARRYKEAGINLYAGLWKGPTEQQLADLKAAGMQVICDQNEVGLKHRDDPTIVGWMHGDEPDNAQPVIDPNTGQQTWGPCIPPERIVADYKRLRAADPTRPILLNLGQGVANDEWHGRGPGAHLGQYETYVQGADIVSFDVYPMAGLEKPNNADYLWYVAKGVERLVQWTGGKRIVWNCLECTGISDPKKKATPHQVRAEAWMALVRGSTGLIWFVHRFAPTFCEWALLEDPEMLAAVTAINRQIHALAPVLNSPTVADGATVTSSAADVPIGHLVKRHGGATYLFTVAMRNAPTTGTFRVRGLPARAKAEVIGEDRSLPVTNGRFTDEFKPYDVHLYRIR
ncbi:MAG: hypothetical protein GX774_22095 [Armatimonadetes bacterium]|nr:hypothetical protein [Armatimonadota bacterium]